MLNILTTSPEVRRQAQPVPTLVPITAISATNIVKAQRSVHERACLAASWIFGRVVIEPRTATMAAAIFDVSGPSVYRAIVDFNDMAANDSDKLNFYWNRASNDERLDFVRANLIPVWDQIERITR
jgi:hypothetical protein